MKRDPEHVALDHHTVIVNNAKEVSRGHSDALEYEWSCDDSGSFVESGPARMFLRTEKENLLLERDYVDSDAIDAKRTESGEAEWVTMSEARALWLLEVLPNAIQELQKKRNQTAKLEMRDGLRRCIRTCGKSIDHIARSAGVLDSTLEEFLEGQDFDAVWLSNVSRVVGFW